MLLLVTTTLPVRGQGTGEDEDELKLIFCLESCHGGLETVVHMKLKLSVDLF